MPLALDTKQAAFAFIGSAWAASPTLNIGGFAGMLAFAQVLAIVGYLASSLPAWAGWVDGTVLQRLTIVQGAVVAILAGNVAFFLALEYEFSQIITLLSAAAGGYGGDKFLAPVLARVFGRGDK